MGATTFLPIGFEIHCSSDLLELNGYRQTILAERRLRALAYVIGVLTRGDGYVYQAKQRIKLKTEYDL